MESVKISGLRTLIRRCLLKGDTDSVLRMFLIKSLMCELDRTFEALAELEEDAIEREVIVEELTSYNPKYLGATYNASADIVPVVMILNAEYDNN